MLTRKTKWTILLSMVLYIVMAAGEVCFADPKPEDPSVLDVNVVGVNESEEYVYEPYSPVSNDLLKQYEPAYEYFKGVQISDKIVYFYQRKIEEAVVQRDFIVYHFDRLTKELLDIKYHWREDLPETLPKVISKERAELMVEGDIRFSQLYYICHESSVFPISPTPENPCWIVETLDAGKISVTVIDAVEGKILGPGIPPPYTAFSLTGPTDISGCSGGWYSWYENARDWFNTMGYSTEGVVWPTQNKVQSHIQSHETAMFYELAHGGSGGFGNACDDSTTASEIETWMTGYSKMPFTFIGSCGGMCSTGDDTLSYELRKGSNEYTVTVGYCGMSDPCCSEWCWYAGYTILWQNALFYYMNQGWTVKAAFDEADASYPGCAIYSCMRFVGDENFSVVPVVTRDRIVYVDADANGTNDGTSWQNAFTDLQDSLDAAQIGDEIWVAEGTYKPSEIYIYGEIGGEDPNDPRYATFKLIDDVGLYGGFAGTETYRNQRNWNANETILSGDIGTIDDNNDNAYRVVTTHDNMNAVIDGFTITRGHANGLPLYERGGGMYNHDSVSSVENCVFSSNYAESFGGGVCNRSGSSSIINCTFEQNSSSMFGGGVSTLLLSDIYITDCVFLGNTATLVGGGLDVYDANALVERCIFGNNSGGYMGGGLNFESIIVPGRTMSATNCLFSGNNAFNGGAIFSGNNDLPPTITNCTFSGNSATNGGGIYNNDCNTTITNCILWNNGNEIYDANSSSPTVSYCDVEGGYEGPNNLDADPCFVDANNGDYHLDVASPCINAGDPNGNYEGQTDIDNDDRVLNGTVDMGADEYGRVKNITQQRQYWYINDAIDEAVDGDEIVAEPDTYEEAVNFDGKAITVRSNDPNDWDVVEATIIDANGGIYTVAFENGEDANSVLTGFTITGSTYIGGVYTSGLMSGLSATPTISRCIIRDNSKGIRAGYNSAPLIRNNKIFNNNSKGVWNEGGGSLSVLNNWIYNNGTGITHGSCAPSEIIGNTIVNNSSYGIFSQAPVELDIRNCILWGNGDDLFNLSATYSCIEDCNDANGIGNICGDANDPLFVDDANDDYHLQPNSPCVDAGDPNGNYDGQTDMDGEPRVQGQRVDIGADEVRRVHNIAADLWYVHIQDAVDEASSGDEIVVYPGIYYESVDFGGKAITVRSIDPNDWSVVDSTIIDGGFIGVTFADGEDENSVLSGITITDCDEGIYCGSSSPVITNCKISGNGAGFTSYNCSATITNCKITGNWYGIELSANSPSVKNCLIYENSYNGISISNAPDANITNNTIVDNGSGIVGGGPSPTITNCILWGNGDDITDYFTATYSCIEDCNDANGIGNICGDANDPLFVDDANDNYHLEPNSPCVDAGDPNGDYEGQTDMDGEPRVQGQRVDIGADEWDGMTNYWKLDEMEGTTTYDSRGNKNGTLTNMDPETDWVEGKVNGALDFDGSNDYVSLPTVDALTGSEVTIAAWVSPINVSGTRTVVFQGHYMYPSYHLYLDAGKATFGIQPWIRAQASEVFDPYEWHHIVGTYDGEYLRIYVDGDLKDTHYYYQQSGTANNGSIGSFMGGGYCFDGVIDDVRVYDRVLDDDEIETLYNSMN